MAEKRKRPFVGLATDLRVWPTNAKRLRQEGDAARDNRDWPAAASAYAAYLKLRSDDARIWVQYGHALKEQGLLTPSESAYRKAIALAPADPDAQLHLAYLLKRLDRPDDAHKMFSGLLEISPSVEVLQELCSMGGAGQAPVHLKQRPAIAVQGGIYIELKDLFVYLSLHTTVTGITRVTLGLLNHILENMGEREAAKYNFVHQFRDAEGLLLISKENMRRVIRAAMTGKPDLGKMQALIAHIQATSILFRLGPGDTYLIPGAFWEFVANPSWIGGMRHRGVRIGAYIYDLIPITHAQFCMKELTEAFTVAFAETVRLLDFALTISAFVAEDVTSYLNANDIAPLTTVPVPLAQELRFGTEEARQDADTADEARPRKYLEGVPFVLCVCTIEARKNHGFIFSIWKRMIEARIAVPDLVFVGRPGWRVEELMDEINESRFLDGRLHILNGLTDDELADLYDRCLFTVFPSHVEGWGLPVGESLAHGKVCVASSASSIPEVGGDYAIYVDPLDLDAGYDAISRLVQEPATLSREQQRVRDGFVPRTWAMMGCDFFTKLDTIIRDMDADTMKRGIFAPSLRPGEMFDVAHLNRVGRRGAAYVRNPTRLIFAEGWRGVEATGTWMLDDEAAVQVQTPCGPRASVSVLLNLGTSPWVGAHNTLTVTAGTATAGTATAGTATAGAVTAGDGASGTAYCRPMAPDRDLWLTVQGRTDDDGKLVVRIGVTGSVSTAQASDIPVTVRFRKLGYVPADDLQARLDLLEWALLAPGSA